MTQSDRLQLSQWLKLKIPPPKRSNYFGPFPRPQAGYFPKAGAIRRVPGGKLILPFFLIGVSKLPIDRVITNFSLSIIEVVFHGAPSTHLDALFWAGCPNCRPPRKRIHGRTPTWGTNFYPSD